MSQIGPAPVLRPLTDERSWFMWFSELSSGLKGRWGQEVRTLALNNLSTPAQQFVNFKANEISFLLIWTSGVTFSTSSISLDKTDPTMRPGMLQVWEGDTQVLGAYCEERLISFPDQALSGRVIVQGSVMVKQNELRR